MEQRPWVFLMGMFALSTVGCARISSQVVEKPRVDQELQGNRGFLVGTPPAPAARKSTRQVIRTDIELATADEMNPWRARTSAPEAPLAASEPVMPTAAEATVPSPAPEPVSVEPVEESQWQPEAPAVSVPVAEEPESIPAATTYTVKAGDTLEKISAKVYGDPSQWRRIYRANQDQLKGPNRIYPGQKLVIPPAGRLAEHRTEESSAEQFK